MSWKALFLFIITIILILILILIIIIYIRELQPTSVLLRLAAALFAYRCTLVWEEQTTLTGLHHLPAGMQTQQPRA